MTDSNNMHNDTIAAVATPGGRGGVGIVRVSGPLVGRVIERIIGRGLKPRYATHARFLDENKEAIDDGIALYFPAPHSFTGEDVLELQGHGGPVVINMVLEAVIQAGARHARPGEFSERAFLNDRLDLAQAEAIADLIDAGSQHAARAALRSLQGKFSEAVHLLLERIIRLRMHVEAAIDFPDEDIDFLADASIGRQLGDVRGQLQQLMTRVQHGRILRDGVTIVMAGKPNAGKSSLLNALAERDAAIVTDIPGTTRDVLREYLQLDGVPLHVVDTAGLRESDDPIEQEGVKRARAEFERADIILQVIDVRDTENPEAIHSTRAAVVRVFNKIDLTDAQSGSIETPQGADVHLSLKTGEGFSLLHDVLRRQLARHETDGEFTARQRHVAALQDVQEKLAHAAKILHEQHAGELVAEELRLAQNRLGEITGEFTADDLLGEIFSSFCIGK